jgi:hypothetical protein
MTKTFIKVTEVKVGMIVGGSSRITKVKVNKVNTEIWFADGDYQGSTKLPNGSKMEIVTN